MEKYNFQIRVTGILIEDEKILLVKQKVGAREWSLPGGRAEAGEKLDDALRREIFEETGLETAVEKLLYVCEKTDCVPPILHITFLLKKISGEIILPTNEFDDNPISDVSFVKFDELKKFGFTEKFISILKNDFPQAGSFMGSKENIGL
jgi:ADP-ribose pyrophosphatase YjhB (NUDIX family)